MFKLFGFVEKTQEVNSQGVGLGLYICKKIAQTFGGDATVESKYGQGSKFTFTFMLEELKEGTNGPQVERHFNPIQRSQKMEMFVRKDGQPDGIEYFNFEACLSERDR